MSKAVFGNKISMKPISIMFFSTLLLATFSSTSFARPPQLSQTNTKSCNESDRNWWRRIFDQRSCTGGPQSPDICLIWPSVADAELGTIWRTNNINVVWKVWHPLSGDDSQDNSSNHAILQANKIELQDFDTEVVLFSSEDLHDTAFISPSNTRTEGYWVIHSSLLTLEEDLVPGKRYELTIHFSAETSNTPNSVLISHSASFRVLPEEARSLITQRYDVLPESDIVFPVNPPIDEDEIRDLSDQERLMLNNILFFRNLQELHHSLPDSLYSEVIQELFSARSINNDINDELIQNLANPIYKPEIGNERPSLACAI
jgi:hypothetical protein